MFPLHFVKSRFMIAGDEEKEEDFRGSVTADSARATQDAALWNNRADSDT